ncbi:collagen alpha-1(I) chain [Vanessa cardui]|uniref:collagen alpha-1(I) chain n=1 Tax=Vanessa cardui TaxID=171605 RepID=UPI001F148775|nr:collagen alpha-1(I) chain [Vanessa cardui]
MHVRQIEKETQLKKIFCNKVTLVGRFFDWKEVENALDISTRVRRQSFTPRGRYRGQTQSQYLAIDRGNGKDEGRAEALSAADSSRASVSGNSGMGQAQSQSLYDPNCDDCYGKSNQEVENLKRPIGYKPGESGYAPNSGSSWPALGQNGGYNPTNGQRFVPGQNNPGELGLVQEPGLHGSNAKPGNRNVQTIGTEPNGPGALGSNNYRPNGATGNGYYPYGNEGTNFRPVPGNNGYIPTGSIDSSLPNRYQPNTNGIDNRYRPNDGAGGFGPGSSPGSGDYMRGNPQDSRGLGPTGASDKNKYTPGVDTNGLRPSGSHAGGYIPNNNAGGPGVDNYNPNQSHRQGDIQTSPGNYVSQVGAYRPGQSPNQITQGGSSNPRQVDSNFTPSVGNGVSGGTFPEGRATGNPVGYGTGQYGTPNANWPVASGPYQVPGGSMYCCVIPNNGIGNVYPNNFEGKGTPTVPYGINMPASGGTNVPGGQYKPGGHYIPGTTGSTTLPGQFLPGNTGGPSAPGGQYGGNTFPNGQYIPTNTGNNIAMPGGQYVPGIKGDATVPGNQYGPGGVSSPSVPGGRFGQDGGSGSSLPGGQYGPGGGSGTTGPQGQYGPGATSGSSVPGGQYGPGGGSSPSVPGGQYAPSGSIGSSVPGGQYGPGGGIGPSVPGGQYGPGGTSGSSVPGNQYGPGGGSGPSVSGGQYGPGGGSGSSVPGNQYGPGGSSGTSVPGGQYGPGVSSGSSMPGGQYGPSRGSGPSVPGGQYGPGGGSVSVMPGGQYSPGGSSGSSVPGGHYGPGGSSGSSVPGGQYGPGGGSGPSIPGGQYGPGGSSGTSVPGGQYGPGGSSGSSVPGGQYGPGGSSGSSVPGGQYGPGTSSGTTVPGGQYGPGGSSGSSLPGGQYGPGTSSGTTVPGGQYGPGGSSGSSLPGGQYGPGTSSGTMVPGGQYGPGGGSGSVMPGGQYGPGGSSGTSVPGGQHGPGGGSGSTVPGHQYGPGGGSGASVPMGQYGPGRGSDSMVPGGQYGPGGGSSSSIPGGQYGPGEGSGSSVPGGQYGPGGISGPSVSGGQYGPNGGSGTSGLGGQYGPSGESGSTVPGGQYGPSGSRGSSTPGGQYIPTDTGGIGQYIPGNQFGPGATGTGPGGQYIPDNAGNTHIPGGQYTPGGAVSPGGQYGAGGAYSPGSGINQGKTPQGFYNQGIPSGQNTDYSGVPQNYLDPNTVAADGDDSEAEANVAQNVNGTTASASSKGGNDKGRAQTSVQGTYTGSGSFQAQAQITGENKEAQSEVSGGKKGASSSASGSGKNNKSQANVQLGSETGSVQTQSQSNGVMHSSNSQVQGSVKGGMADAQARGPGSTSSQAQIGFTPYKDGDKSRHDLQRIPFTGGGMASAQSSGRTGQSQSQLHGTFKYGITYNGAAQSGASLDKDAVFPNRLSFDKIDVFDEKEKNINVDKINMDITETPQSLDYEPAIVGSSSLPESSSAKEKVEIPTTENIIDESMKNSESRYSGHPHTDHHTPDSDNTTFSNGPTLLGSRRSFKTNYGSMPDYEFTTDKDETQPEYDTDVGYEGDGNEASDVEQNEYSNYDEYSRDSPTHQYLQNSNRKGLEVQQTTGGNTQHIILGALKDQNAEIIQKDTERPDENRVYLPGERVPGTGGYTIPVGFTGSVKSVASKDKTYVVGSKDFPSQAQTVTLTPGKGKVKYTHPSTYGKYVKPKNLRSLQSSKENDNNRYVSVSKSVTRALDSDNNIRKQYSHTYYTKSSSCGYFTFTCTMVSSAEGRKKVCKPKMPTNPDGTPIRC